MRPVNLLMHQVKKVVIYGSGLHKYPSLPYIHFPCIIVLTEKYGLSIFQKVEAVKLEVLEKQFHSIRSASTQRNLSYGQR
jgi:hypothetical protein